MTTESQMWQWVNLEKFERSCAEVGNQRFAFLSRASETEFHRWTECVHKGWRWDCLTTDQKKKKKKEVITSK